MLTGVAHRQTVSDPLLHPFVEEGGFFFWDSTSNPVIFAQVETSQIAAPMDRYESRMKPVSDSIRSGIFILMVAGVYEMRIHLCSRKKKTMYTHTHTLGGLFVMTTCDNSKHVATTGIIHQSKKVGITSISEKTGMYSEQTVKLSLHTQMDYIS